MVALSIALPRVLPGRSEVGGAQATGNPGTTPNDTIPPYYVALTRTSSNPVLDPLDITVRSTMTGAPLATVEAPAPYGTFSLVARGDDDDTFVVGAQRWQEPGLRASSAYFTVTLMLLHFNPATRSVSFSSLPVPALFAGRLQSVALSPDGSQLAVGVQASPTVLDLDVYSLAGGGVRTWSLRGAAAAQWSIDISNNGEGGGGTNPNAMSWLPDGRTLAFDLSEFDGTRTLAETVRELDVDGPGGGLLADSRAVFTLDPRTAPFECTDALQLSAAAATVACAGYEGQSYSAASATAGSASAVTPSPAKQSHAEDSYGFGVFSVASGRLTAVLDPTPLNAPLLVDPRLFWQGGGALIGTLSGPVIILNGSQEHSTPGDVDSTPPGDAVDAAW